MQIMGLIGMCFDPAVVFVTSRSLLFRFALAILWRYPKLDYLAVLVSLLIKFTCPDSSQCPLVRLVFVLFLVDMSISIFGAFVGLALQKSLFRIWSN